jgi:hypothetical protein
MPFRKILAPGAKHAAKPPQVQTREMFACRGT